MSEHGEKKNPDKLNTVAIVTVGLTGAALVYLSIIGVETLYLGDAARVNKVAKFGRQGETMVTLRATQVGKVTGNGGHEALTGGKGRDGVQLYVVPIEAAMDLVVRDVKVDPANLVPAVSRSEFTTIKPVFGRPQVLSAPQPIGQSAPVVDPAAPVDGAAPDGAAPADATAPAGATAPVETGAAATPPATAPATTTPVPSGANPR
ncbi:MAG: hypothetical protein R3B06_17555 [Kofleriaceae bacterium]